MCTGLKCCTLGIFLFISSSLPVIFLPFGVQLRYGYEKDEGGGGVQEFSIFEYNSVIHCNDCFIIDTIHKDT